MCGIAGIVGPPDRTAELLPRMLSAIAHRGPDDSGQHIGEEIAFGATRLAVIDIAGGHQPMWAPDESVGIAYNGEIYNAHDLAQDLTRQGREFQTQCDTETVLQLYQAGGADDLPSMFQSLRGMFGVAIYDAVRHRLVLARDPFGIKPLYYRLAADGSLAAFASEMKSLLVDPACPRVVNQKALVSYLSLQFNPLAESFLVGIYRLPPGSLAVVDLRTGHINVQRYWTYGFDDTATPDEEELAERVRSTVEESVDLHLISDVPVGALLSGGIDSAIIVTLAQEQLRAAGKESLKTFTLGFEGLNEFAEAREVADRLETDHHEIMITGADFIGALPDIAWYFDEPVANPSSIPLYFVTRAAREHVCVVLSGEGADEIFGGYRVYREPFALDHVRRLPYLARAVAAMLGSVPIAFRGRNYLRRAALPLEKRYVGGGYGTFTAPEVRRLLKGTMESDHFRPGEVLAADPGYTAHTDSRRMQLIDINYWLWADNLATADRMSMANSVELRVPYLDAGVAAVSATIPDTLKYRDGTTKWLLRHAFGGRIPEATAQRQKLGFPTPLRRWFTQDPDAMLAIIRHSRHLDELIDLSYVEELAAQHARGKVDASRRFFLLLMLAAWLDAYMNGDVAAAPSRR